MIPKFCCTFSQNLPISSLLWRNCRRVNQTWDLAAVSMQAGREQQRRCFIWSTLEKEWRWWQITVILKLLSSQECRKRRSSEESLHHTHRENKLCRLCLALHVSCFRAFTVTLGILVSGIVLLQWTELGSDLLRVLQQNLIWKKKSLAFKTLLWLQLVITPGLLPLYI